MTPIDISNFAQPQIIQRRRTKEHSDARVWISCLFQTYALQNKIKLTIFVIPGNRRNSLLYYLMERFGGWYKSLTKQCLISSVPVMDNW